MNNLKLDFKSTCSLQNVQAKTWNQTAWSCLVCSQLQFAKIFINFC